MNRIWSAELVLLKAFMYIQDLVSLAAHIRIMVLEEFPVADRVQGGVVDSVEGGAAAKAQGKGMGLWTDIDPSCNSMLLVTY